MKFYSLMLALVAVFAVASQSNAAIVISVDVDPNTAGIQSSNAVDLEIGDQITANLVLSLAPGDSLFAYGFSTQFGSGLQFVSRSEPQITGWTEAYTDNSGAAGFQYFFDGVGGATQNGPFNAVVGTLTFAATQSGTFAINSGFFNPTPDFEDFLDGNFNVIDRGTIGFSGATVNVAAVPEPTSMAALAAAGVGGWIVRRRASRKKAAAE